MYYAKEEGIDIYNTLEDEQPDAEENEVEGKRRKMSEKEKTEETDELRTNKEEEPTPTERKKLGTNQALTTCKEETVISSSEEAEDLPAEQVQEDVEEATKKAGAASPTLDPFSREATETEGESDEEYPPIQQDKDCPDKDVDMDEESERKLTTGEKYRHIYESKNNDEGDVSLQIFMDNYSQMEK